MEEDPKIMSVQISTSNSEEVDYNDLYLRSLADFQNYKRRAEAENARIKKEATFDFVENLIPIIDDIELSIILSHKVGNDDKGLEIIYNEIQTLLGKYGIERYGDFMDDFDPDLHEAIAQTNDGQVESGKISQLIRYGYRSKDKIIRYAKVNVEK